MSCEERFGSGVAAVHNKSEDNIEMPETNKLQSAFIQDENSLQSPISLRWGEYPVIKEGKDQRNFDGFSRLRNNFDCCHIVPLEGKHDKFDGFMIPKPNQQDAGQFVNEKTFRTSSQARTATYEVFPKHDPNRTDKQGEFVLSKSSRDAIGKFHRKLYCTPRYGLSYPEHSSESCPLPETTPLYDVRGVKRVRFADDHGYNLEMKPTPREDWEQIANIAKWPRFADEDNASTGTYSSLQHHNVRGRCKDHNVRGRCKETVHDNTHLHEDTDENKSRDSKDETDINQNFHDLIPIIYNYKLPSALHDSQNRFVFDSFVEDLKEDLPEVTPQMTYKFQRPIYPLHLLADMKAVTDEIHIMNQPVQPTPRTIPEYTRSCFPNFVDQWTNSSILEKQKLENRSLSQRTYHMDHPEPLPDLRDHTTYSKKVFFGGFNSSAFRG